MTRRNGTRMWGALQHRLAAGSPQCHDGDL